LFFWFLKCCSYCSSGSCNAVAIVLLVPEIKSLFYSKITLFPILVNILARKFAILYFFKYPVHFRNQKNKSCSISGTRRIIATAFQEPEEQ
jgi:hypothetical protein